MTRTQMRLTVSLTVVSMVLGFMVSLQYRNAAQHRQGTIDDATTADTEVRQLSAELNQLKKSNAEAQKQLTDIDSQIASYEAQSIDANQMMQSMENKLSSERILAGTTAVRGPGISITIMDGTGANPEAVLTHDWDVRATVNELFTAGAEAVSINGYRVVATSGIYCSGPVVRINDHKISAPFVIDAIGDPSTLKSALTAPGMLMDFLRNSAHLNVSDPEEETNITMPAFTGNSPSAGNGVN